MKRILFLALVITLMMSLSVTVFAENSVTSDSGTTIDISATFKAGSTAEDVISVDIAWGAMEFEFSEGVDGVWDPTTHQYTGATESSWSSSGNEITVTNHSNVSVAVSMSITPVDGTGVDVSLTGGNATLAAGEVGNVDGAASVTGTIKVSGKPNSTVTENGIKVASITVTIQ